MIGFEHQLRKRVIIHLDMDCFYCQVEQKRLGLSSNIPCAVQQWEGLIAVNYAAKGQGVKRGMRISEARKICPDIQFVHVQVKDQSGCDLDTSSIQSKDILRGKACLERYRDASDDVISLIEECLSGTTCKVQKASVDEVFIDVTEEAKLQAKQYNSDQVSITSYGSIVVGDSLIHSDDYHHLLSEGAGIACRLRSRIQTQLKFTSSAGIGPNKMLAKFASAMKKPNQQVIVAPEHVQDLLYDLPVHKLRFLGGKLGDEVVKLKGETVGQAQQIPANTLIKNFGEDRGRWIFKVLRGVCEEEVEARNKNKSMLAAKSFTATSDMEQICLWLKVLVQELSERINQQWTRRKLHPRTLAVCHRQQNGAESVEHRKQIRMPNFTCGNASPEILQKNVIQILTSQGDKLFPCNRLMISAQDFQQEAQNTPSIKNFFSAKKIPQRKQIKSNDIKNQNCCEVEQDQIELDEYGNEIEKLYGKDQQKINLDQSLFNNALIQSTDKMQPPQVYEQNVPQNLSVTNKSYENLQFQNLQPQQQTVQNIDSCKLDFDDCSISETLLQNYSGKNNPENNQKKFSQQDIQLEKFGNLREEQLQQPLKRSVNELNFQHQIQKKQKIQEHVENQLQIYPQQSSNIQVEQNTNNSNKFNLLQDFCNNNVTKNQQSQLTIAKNKMQNIHTQDDYLTQSKNDHEHKIYLQQYESNTKQNLLLGVNSTNTFEAILNSQIDETQQHQQQQYKQQYNINKQQSQYEQQQNMQQQQQFDNSFASLQQNNSQGFQNHQNININQKKFNNSKYYTNTINNNNQYTNQLQPSQSMDQQKKIVQQKSFVVDQESDNKDLLKDVDISEQRMILALLEKEKNKRTNNKPNNISKNQNGQLLISDLFKLKQQR